MKKLLTLLSFISWSLFGLAQNGSITGTVTSQSGETLIGANIVIKGTTQGASSNTDGQYNLSVAAGDYTLLASYIGFASAEKKSQREKRSDCQYQFQFGRRQ